MAVAYGNNGNNGNCNKTIKQRYDNIHTAWFGNTVRLLLLVSNKLFKKLSQKLLAVRKHETEKKRMARTADHRMLISQ